MVRFIKQIILLLIFSFIILIFYIGGDNHKNIDYDISEIDKNYEIITFGKYEQDGIIENGKEDIEWYVIDKVGDKSLFITKKILCGGIITYGNVDYKKSNVRKFLNEDFFNTAFSTDEKKLIINKDNKKNTDKLFILSTNEINHYFNEDKKRISEITPYAIMQNVYSATIYENLCGAWYWTSDVGFDKTSDIQVINANGKINIYGYHYDTYGMGIRPAMWVKR